MGIHCPARPYAIIPFPVQVRPAPSCVDAGSPGFSSAAIVSRNGYFRIPFIAGRMGKKRTGTFHGVEMSPFSKVGAGGAGEVPYNNRGFKCHTLSDLSRDGFHGHPGAQILGDNAAGRFSLRTKTSKNCFLASFVLLGTPHAKQNPLLKVVRRLSGKGACHSWGWQALFLREEPWQSPTTTK